MLPVIVLAALVSAGLLLSQKTSQPASGESPEVTQMNQPYKYQRILSTEVASDAASAARQTARMDSQPPRTVTFSG